MIDPNASAFPHEFIHRSMPEESARASEGMSIRVHLAGLAMQGFAAYCGVGGDDPIYDAHRKHCAASAVQMADALIAALNKAP